MKRHVRSRILVAALLFTVGVVGVGITPASAADPYGAGEKRIPGWSPRHIYTIMSNTSPADVQYHFRFTPGAAAMASPAFYDPLYERVSTLEFGYKDTGHQNCRNPRSFGQIGIPSAVRPQVDYSEDSTDAVLWLTTLPALRNDQLANPTKDYVAFWKCDADADFRSNPAGEIGPFEAQLGYSQYYPQEPAFTFAARTTHLVPREQAHKGIPSVGDGRAIHLAFDTPWPRDWDFEANRTTNWTPAYSTLTNFCCNYDAPQGGGYLYVAPLASGQSQSFAGQGFRIRGSSGETGQLMLGNNTGVQSDVNFRCPIWSPAISGKLGTSCSVTVYVKTSANADYRSVSYMVPADGKWYYGDKEIVPSQTSDDDLTVWIDTRGYHMDVDGVWLSSGL